MATKESTRKVNRDSESGEFTTDEHVKEDPAGTTTETVKTRRTMGDRGWLQGAVRTLTDNFVRGTVNVPDNKPLTPHRVSAMLVEQGLAKEPPSTGAVSAVFHRWQDYGFAEFSEKPFAFTGYTEEARKLGFDGIMEARKDTRKAERAAAKAAAAPAAEPEA